MRVFNCVATAGGLEPKYLSMRDYLLTISAHEVCSLICLSISTNIVSCDQTKIYFKKELITSLTSRRLTFLWWELCCEKNSIWVHRYFWLSLSSYLHSSMFQASCNTWIRLSAPTTTKWKQPDNRRWPPTPSSFSSHQGRLFRQTHLLSPS